MITKEKPTPEQAAEPLHGAPLPAKYTDTADIPALDPFQFPGEPESIEIDRTELPDHQSPIPMAKPFAAGLCFYKLVWIFIIGCLIGYCVEMIWCYINQGFFESRKGLLYGPFTPVYGFGGILLTLALYPLRKKNGLVVFVISAVAGALFEYVCSWFQEIAFGTVSWDYSGSHLNLNGRTNLQYAVFWGLLGMIFIKHTYPFLCKYIERIPRRVGVVLTWIFLAFMVFNIVISGLAVRRWTDRRLGQPPSNAVDVFLDDAYPDEYMLKVYPHMKVVE